MLASACPHCGAEVIFRSPTLPVKVCDYCRTLVMRAGDELRSMGTAAVLPFDVSPVQIGTRGTFMERAFEIVGRVRWGWVSGSWNEWLMLFEDGRHGWLAEAMGQFMVTLPWPLDKDTSPAIQSMADGRDAKLGDQVEIGNTVYQVVDIKSRARCIAAEGELPFTAPAGWTITNIDMRSDGGEFASFQRDRTQSDLYVGCYVSLPELRPRGLRTIDGWAQPSFAG